ncbi:leucyl aminopeptidase [Tepidamorphus gemmatus]|uniref:Leucyl aminopeptidase n=1 Tax=Tepidamorphus gemmatus TaxID=747076 RepID=A0A4R3MH69_9HYPH|nr:leucyl aminopeptidase family protein [Tepidamorphus gemmatus]TCT13171.1 leucyl aminopeptidase [Tepidamorphus gemmatus]
MTDRLLPPTEADRAVPIRFVDAGAIDACLAELTETQRAFARASGFEPKAGRVALLPDTDGGLGLVLFGLGKPGDIERTPLLPGKLVDQLPAGTYRFANAPDDAALAALAVLLGAYRFDTYRKATAGRVSLVAPDGVDAAEIERIAAGVHLARDLINTPANDMGPAELEAAARALAVRHGATIEVTTGDALLEARLPMIHAVGRASDRAPRLIDLTWGAATAPKLTLVGKGVCFDTGGLDIKPSAAMLLMKKDMGGAACVLGLAAMIMSAGLEVRLRVLIPAVENAIGANAFRPGDVLRGRNGTTVEIGNTDAEGRLVLADALSLACEESPELVIDIATLTGAARVALGPDLPALFSPDDRLAAAIARAGDSVADPVWRLPLWRPYGSMIDSKVADINNAGASPFAGAITAAIFLCRFVGDGTAWAHLDAYCWNQSSRPARPEGGEAQTIRALYAMIRDRFGA